jgi:hypothetical protein
VSNFFFEKMVCAGLNWVERFDILSPSQFGFRKGRGARECLSLLGSVLRIFFERKENTLVAFLDISRVYNNVLIDVL